MSSSIETARAQGFATSVFMLSQQKESRCRPACRVEMVSGEKARFFDRVGTVEFDAVTVRNGDTVYSDMPHTRRMVTGTPYRKATLLDKPDKLRMVWDPTGSYQEAFRRGFGRKIDDIVIAAISAAAATGEDGSSTTSLGNGQKIASTNGTTAGDLLNINALIHTKQIMDGNEVDDMDRYLFADSLQISNLLKSTQVTSADYNTVKALVRGEIDTFMGFQFIRTERLLSQSSTLNFAYSDGSVGSGSGDANGYTKCLAVQKNGMLLALWEDYQARVTEESQKNFSTQVWAEFYAGAVRMEEESVVEILCATS